MGAADPEVGPAAARDGRAAGAARDGDAASRLEELRAEAKAELARGPSLPDARAQGVPVPAERDLHPAAGQAPRGVGDELPREFLDQPPMDLHTWYQVWSRDVPAAISSHRAGLGGLIVKVKKVLRKFVRAPIADLFDRQRVYNAVLVHNITALQESVRVLAERSVPAMVQRADALHAVQDQRLEATVHELGELHGLCDRLTTELYGLRDNLERELYGLRDELRVADRDGAALVQDGHAQLRQSLVRLESRIQALREAPAAEATAAAVPGPAAPQAAAAADAGSSVYIDFESLYRGSEQAIREAQRFYLPFFRGLPGPVADLGAGRGEFLELCRDEGIAAYGVDGDPDMVARAAAKGLKAVSGDLLGHLASLPDGSLGGVFMAQVVEHLPRTALLELARLCALKVAPGGRVAMETQNPLSPMVLARNFYLDLTHDRPIHPEGLRFLLEASGFRTVEVSYLSPFPEGVQIPRPELAGLEGETRRVAVELDRTVARMNQLLFGHQDFAVIATR